MIKILIADDQDLIRESLKIVLDMNNDMKVVGLAENGNKVLDFVKKNVPDVILMDIRMPEIDGGDSYRHERRLNFKRERHYKRRETF